jgi:hypothetical protein
LRNYVHPGAQSTAALPINDVSVPHRCGHDGQRKRVAHMPTVTTATEVGGRFIIGLKASTRLHDEANFFLAEESKQHEGKPETGESGSFYVQI